MDRTWIADDLVLWYQVFVVLCQVLLRNKIYNTQRQKISYSCTGPGGRRDDVGHPPGSLALRFIFI